MEQQALFYEDIFDALRTCVLALGGFKVVGSKLRPELDPHKAGEWLADCLNRARAQKPEMDHVMWILREAKAAGCHAGMYYIARDAGYAEPPPITPQDELSDLQRRFIEAAKTQDIVLKRIERLMPNVRVVA